MIKKIFVLLILVVFLFSGCQNEKNEISNPDELNVYHITSSTDTYVISTAKWEEQYPDKTLNLKVVFEDSDAIDLLAVEILSGDSPDMVIGFPTAAGNAEEKSAALLYSILQKDLLCDLKPFLENKNYEEILPLAFLQTDDSGKIHGLNMQSALSMFACTEEREEQFGLHFKNDMTVQEFSDQISNYLMNSDSSIVFDKKIPFSNFLKLTGVTLLEQSEIEAFLSSEDFQVAADCYRKLYDPADASFYSSSQSGATSYAAVIKHFLDGDSLLCSAGIASSHEKAALLSQIAEENIGEHLTVYAYPSFESPVVVGGLLGVVFEDSPCKEEAFSLLYSEFKAWDGVTAFTPLTKTKLESQKENMETDGFAYSDLFGLPYTPQPLSRTISDNIENLVLRARLSIFEPTVGFQFIDQCMQPYFDGSESFEQARATLIGKTALYLGE